MTNQLTGNSAAIANIWRTTPAWLTARVRFKRWPQIFFCFICLIMKRSSFCFSSDLHQRLWVFREGVFVLNTYTASNRPTSGRTAKMLMWRRNGQHWRRAAVVTVSFHLAAGVQMWWIFFCGLWGADRRCQGLWSGVAVVLRWLWWGGDRGIWDSWWGFGVICTVPCLDDRTLPFIIRIIVIETPFLSSHCMTQKKQI